MSMETVWEFLGQVPWWSVLDVFKAAALPAAGVYVAYKFGSIQAAIGRQQAATASMAMQTAQSKLRLDLFEKRLAVYNAAARALTIAQTRGDPLTGEEYGEYMRAVQPARWLFSNNVASLLLTHIPSRLLSLHRARYYSPEEDAEASDGYWNKLDVLEWLHQQETELARLLTPYLLFEERSQK